MFGTGEMAYNTLMLKHEDRVWIPVLRVESVVAETPALMGILR